MREHPRYLLAGNGGPFTLDGTRTFLVGEDRLAVLDPGPDDDAHVDAVAAAVSGARVVRVVLTHGHPDHAGCARRLAERLDAEVWGPPGTGVDRSVADGDVVPTDRGDLVAVPTPGHTRHHLGYLWPAREALFVGDLFLGEGDTTWVGEYPGCVADYLASLRRVRELGVRVLYPAHGPPLEDVPGAVSRYERHRRQRIEQVERALAEQPEATTDELLEVVYGGELPEGVRQAAQLSVEALVEHVRAR